MTEEKTVQHGWEEVWSGSTDYTQRMRIRGGWLYRTCVAPDPDSRNTTVAVALVFVPEKFGG